MTQQYSQEDIRHTRRALELAAQGVGQVSPNPLVGCVIVSREGKIVGEGSYFYDDVVHAEAVALAQAGELSRGATAYVSLEPHDHQHRTPPCSLALISAGIKRVVCPVEDPNPIVSGNGFARLREHGVEVVTGILADEARRLNEKFNVWHQKGRPFVHLKLATSFDGRISLNNRVSTPLSGESSAKRVHDFRHQHDAILIGGNTAVIDNPSLTDRSGRKRRRKLVRVVLDNRLQIPLTSRLVQTAQEFPTIVFSNSSDEQKVDSLLDAGVELIRTDARALENVLAALKKRELQSVLVEGGTAIAGAFIDSRLVDKVSMMVAPFIIGGNAAPPSIGGAGATTLAEALRLADLEVVRHGGDIEISGYPEKGGE